MSVLDMFGRFREFRMAGLLAAVASFATIGDAVAADTAAATASAAIVKPVALAEVSQLNFGTVRADGSAGIVAISPGGELSSLGVEVSDQDEADSASMKMFGGDGQAYTISLPRAVTFGSGRNMVEIGGFTHDAGITPALDSDGYAHFNIGATLILREGRDAAGRYAADLPVTVSNN